jgi:hypothetical protein
MDNSECLPKDWDGRLFSTSQAGGSSSPYPTFQELPPKGYSSARSLPTLNLAGIPLFTGA